MDKFSDRICKHHGMTEHKLKSGGVGRVKHECRLCAAAYNFKRIRDRKMQLVTYKGGQCESCGYKKSMSALQFHHKDPSEKEFALSTRMTRSLSTLLLEVDKCSLLCANCHAELHEKEDIKKGAKAPSFR